jgi:glycosyltransferase involved in cell wall biosynthesis
MLEAMALGVPLVATPICCEGLPVVPGKHLLVAEDAAQFASAIEELLDNPAKRENIIHSARAYVERHHNWSESVEALSKSYEDAIADLQISAKGNPQESVNGLSAFKVEAE